MAPKGVNLIAAEKGLIEEANEIIRAETIRDGLAKLTTEEGYRRLVEREIQAAPVLSQAEVLEDPKITHNKWVIEGEHPVCGEQSDAILDELGVSDDQRLSQHASGAVTS